MQRSWRGSPLVRSPQAVLAGLGQSQSTRAFADGRRVAIELHLLRTSENRSLPCSLSPRKPCVYVRNQCANARVPGLESWRPFTGLVGSNPTLSAMISELRREARYFLASELHFCRNLRQKCVYARLKSLAVFVGQRPAGASHPDSDIHVLIDTEPGIRCSEESGRTRVLPEPVG
jgi:hypothetical protein